MKSKKLSIFIAVNILFLAFPALSEQQNFKMIVSNVNEFTSLRSKPSIKRKRLKKVPLGTEVRVIKRNSRGWYKVSYKGKKGWIHPKYLASASSKKAQSFKGRNNAYKKTMIVSNVSDFTSLRSKPSTKKKRLKKIPLGTEVQVIKRNPRGWYKVSYKGKKGWVHPKYLASTNPEQAQSFKSRNDAYKKIMSIADKHKSCVSSRSKHKRYNTASLRQRIGYYHGVTINFARSLCRGPSDIKRAMLNGGRKDVLQHFSRGSHKVKLYGARNGSEKNLISLYALLLPHGLRESGGDYRDGIDRAANNNSANTTEAGLYQTSYNVHGLLKNGHRQAAKALLAKYSNNRQACMNDIFNKKKPKQKRYYRSTGKKSSAGYQFQQLMRSCPAAAVEHTAITARHGYHHYGPLKRKETRPMKKCYSMLEDVYSYVKRNPDLCNNLSITPRPPQQEEDIDSDVEEVQI